jgi:molybdate transport system regulatory protein
MAKPTIKFRVDFGPCEAIGPGKIALLEQIDRSGSISQAARNLGMSYRRGWLLVESLNDSFREPLTMASTGGKGGGGVTLTSLGHEVIRTYRLFETEVQEQAARHFLPLARQARKTLDATKIVPKVRMSARQADSSGSDVIA